MREAPAEILFATSNAHKIEEVAAILAPLDVRVIGLDALPAPLVEPVEDGDTFEANARIKAVAYARGAGRPCLADDSGLEVDALDGAPGVHSARYAGGEGDRAERDRRNNEKLLEALRDVPAPERTARFVCAMCLADASGNVVAEVRGEFAGVIAERAAGRHGFGYDPLFHVPETGCTSAELSPDEKNARSHRGAAARRMARRVLSLES